MPKVTILHYKHENLKFSYTVYINQEGIFSTTIPSNIVSKLEKVGIDCSNKNRMGNKGYFTAKTLKELNDVINETVDIYTKKKLISEDIIIKYAVNTICSYCKGKSGTLYPNGNWEDKKEGYEDYCHWIDGTTEEHGVFSGGLYEFSVAFRPLKKLKWQFPNGEESIEYIRLEDDDVKDDELLNWLHSLCNMNLTHASNIKEIKYTKEVGIMFKKMVMFIWNINENIKSMCGDKFDLETIINKQLTGKIIGLGED